jgi:hypothetical protein
VLGFTLFLLFVGAAGVGAWFYFKTHPLRLEEPASTAGKPLPRSGDSPSAYRYVMGRLRRPSGRRT